MISSSIQTKIINETETQLMLLSELLWQTQPIEQRQNTEPNACSGKNKVRITKSRHNTHAYSNIALGNCNNALVTTHNT